MRGAGALLLLLLIAGCGSSSVAAVPTLSPSIQPSPTAGAGLKPALGGLLDRDGPPPTGYAAVMGGFVVNVFWADIQPEPNGAIRANNAIDQAVTTLRSLDTSGRMGLKVRLFAGIHAPEWAKSLGGAPISITDPVTGASGTVGRFWSPEFGAAYSDLMTKLSAKYDSVPAVREITISRCTTAYAEPFIRDAANSVAVSNLLAAGFTVAADKQCHQDEVIAHEVWAHTRSDLSFNPYQVIDGSARSDERYTEAMMDFCRATLGQRCVLANNSLRVPLQFPQMYDHIHALGPPIAFQTAVMAKVGDLAGTIDTAIGLGAASVELPAGFESLSINALGAFNSSLAAQAAT